MQRQNEQTTKIDLSNATEENSNSNSESQQRKINIIAGYRPERSYRPPIPPTLTVKAKAPIEKQQHLVYDEKWDRLWLVDKKDPEETTVIMNEQGEVLFKEGDLISSSSLSGKEEIAAKLFGNPICFFKSPNTSSESLELETKANAELLNSKNLLVGP